jgi:hypothetical protein
MMYVNIFVFAAGAIALAIGCLLMQREVKLFSITRPTIPAVFFFTFLVMSYFPSFAVWHNMDGAVITNYILGLFGTVICVPIGICLANRALAYRHEESDKYLFKRVESEGWEGGMYGAHVIIMLGVLFVLGDYCTRTPEFPIFEAFTKTATPDSLQLAREESFKLLDPRWGGPNSTPLFIIFLFLRTIVFPLLLMTTLGYALKTKTTSWRIICGITWVLGILYAVSSLARAPVSALFMRAAFFIYFFKCGKIGKKAVLIFAAFTLIFPLYVTTYLNSTSRNILDGLYAILLRLTYSPALDLYHYFDVFPKHHGYLYGQTLIRPFCQLFGIPCFYVENFMSMHISPTNIVTAHTNAAFPSNLNADFGLFGVMFGAIIVGAMIQYVQITIVRAPKTILNMALYAFMVYAVWVLNFGSINSVLLANGGLLVWVFASLLRKLAIVLSTGFREKNDA